MQSKTRTLGFLFSLLSAVAVVGTAHAHGPGGKHKPPPEISAKKAKEIATKRVADLVKREKLEESWASVKASSAEKKKNKHATEWVVLFLNDKAADADKRKLYVFLTLAGEYVAANHTGK